MSNSSEHTHRSNQEVPTNVNLTMSKSSHAPYVFTRRKFLRVATTTAAALAAPLIVPSRLLGAEAPSNRLRVGQIGCGRIATVHDMPGVLKSELADIVAVCDLDSARLAAGKRFVETFKHKKEMPRP